MALKLKQYPSDKLSQSLVRWPEGMRRIIEKRAAKTGRSMNAEIIALVKTGLLQSHLKDSNYTPSGQISPELVLQLEVFLDDWRSKVALERLTKSLPGAR